MNNTRIAIIYQSGFGHTTEIVTSIKQGAESVEKTQVDLIPAEEAVECPDQLNDYDAMIFGSPTSHGNVGRVFRSFMEATTLIKQKKQWCNKIASGFTDAHKISGDKLNTLACLYVFASEHGMVWMGSDGLNHIDENHLHSKQINRMGDYLGLSVTIPTEKSNTVVQDESHQTAYCFGQRMACVAKSTNI